MPEPIQHVRPFVYNTADGKALHFTIADTQSHMLVDRPDALSLEYTRRMMGFLLFNKQPLTIGMVGLGGGSLAKFCHRYLPTSRILVAEINPHVIALRDEFSVPPDGQRFTVRCSDGAQWVRDLDTPLNVLLVDGFDYEGQPEALCSQVFYDDCFASLAPDGLLVSNQYRDHPHFGAHLTRLERSFDNEVLQVGGGDEANCIAIACKGQALRRRQALLLRKPAHIAATAWDALLPALSHVATALTQYQTAVPQE